nr:hypothetical protein [Gammaproteobacteria bacterium]
MRKQNLAAHHSSPKTRRCPFALRLLHVSAIVFCIISNSTVWAAGSVEPESAADQPSQRAEQLRLMIEAGKPAMAVKELEQLRADADSNAD